MRKTVYILAAAAAALTSTIGIAKEAKQSFEYEGSTYVYTSSVENGRQVINGRRFPSGQFIRKPDQLDYLQEPDIFHDVFGHVPMLTDPDFAAYMQAYGQGGQRAAGLGMLQNLARLYWYTVEFGLMQDADGLRIYGAGIVSSATESVFALEDPSPNRLGFDLERVMKTLYRIDDFQQVYFVIDGIEQLKRETLQDFGPIYERQNGAEAIPIETILPTDKVFTRGTQSYAAKGGRFAA